MSLPATIDQLGRSRRKRKPQNNLSPDGLTHEQSAVLVEHWRGLDDDAIAKKLDLVPALVRKIQKTAGYKAAYARLELRHAARVDTQIRRIQEELDKIAFGDVSTIYNQDWTTKPLGEWPEAMKASCRAIGTRETFAGRGEERKQVGYPHK